MNNINHFLNVINIIDQVADHFHAAHDYFKGQHAPGRAALCWNEAMEMWRLKKKVKEYVFDSNGVIPQKPATPAIQMNWNFSDVLPMLKEKQMTASSALSGTVTALRQADGDVDAYFLSKIYRKHLPEVREICEIVDHSISDHFVVDFDSKLYEKYGREHCSCGDK